MFKRKLSALNYPGSNVSNISDEKEFKKLMIWLEENKIKHYSTQGRKNLLNASSSDWKKNFEQYKRDINCPFTNNSPLEEIDWFLGYSVKMDYNKKKAVYEKHAIENIKSSNTPSVIADNPLDHLDFGGKDFDDGIKQLSQMLKVNPHPNPFVTLKAISKVVCNRLSAYAMEHPQEYIIKGTPFPFQDADLGFDLGDPVLNKAAKILRLLYIQNLRDLQTKANELVVAVQGITANPKTDTKLGKVGK